MKDSKNDSTPVLARFGRDKRARMVTSTAERVERRPRLQRDAADSEQSDHERKPFRRTSYNPHFTADNRPMFETPHHGEPHSYADGERPRRTQSDDARPHNPQERTHTSYGDRPRYSRERSHASFDDKPRSFRERGSETSDDRPRRTFGDKPAYGAKNPTAGFRSTRSSEHKSPEHKFSGRKPFDAARGDHASGPRKYGDKPSRGSYSKKPAPASYPKYAPDAISGEIRLNRFIAQSGICSRREADDYILAGVVTVNGKVVTELGTKVLPTDEVRFNDQRLQGEKKVYLVLNKPKGYVTSLDDPHAGKTVMELVKGACTERIYPAGRLDKNSLGLLLFTNDGDLTKQLTHPSYKKKKIYQVTLDKPLTRADMDRIAEGITLEDGEIYADEISYVKDNKQEVGIEIHSGRNRIVRRIFEFLGYTVTKLDRVYYAGLTKKNLKRGAWRFLTREEVERLKSGQYE